MAADIEKLLSAGVLDSHTLKHALEFEKFSDGVLVFGADGALVDAGPGAERLLNASRLELIGQIPKQIYHPATQTLGLDALLATLEYEGRWSAEIQILRGAEAPRECELVVIPLRNDEGQSIVHIGIIHDLTDKKNYKARLAASESRFREVIDGSTQGIVIFRDDSLLFANQALAKIFGYALNEVLALESVNWLVDSEDRERIAVHHNRVLSGEGGTAVYEFKGVHKNGSVIWLHARTRSVIWDGAPAVEIALMDITAPRKSELKLMRHALAFEQIADAVISTDKNRRIIEWNAVAERVFGYTFEEVAGKIPTFLFDDEIADDLMQSILIESEKNGQWRGEMTINAKDGTQHICDTTILTLHGENGEYLGRVGIHVDITQRKQGEERMRRDALAFSKMSEGVVVSDSDWKIFEWNARAEQMFGYTKEEALGRTPDFLFPKNLAAEYSKAANESLRNDGIWHSEVNIIRKDGMPIICDINLAQLKNDEGDLQAIVAVHKDITAQKKAEQDLRDGEQRFRTLFDDAATGMVVMSLEGIPFAVNQAFSDMLGYDADELLDLDFIDIIHEEDRRQVQTIMESMHAGEQKSTHYDTRLLHKAGHPVWAQINASVVLDYNEKPFYVIQQILDITERIKAREERLAYSSELERSNRDLNDFAHVASHDLQEPLRVIEGHIETLKNDFAQQVSPEAIASLDAMAGSASRMRNLIHGLLSFSRVTTQHQPFQPVDLEMIMLQVMMDLKARSDELDGRIEFSDLPIIDADPLQMHQLLQNLVGNALKFHKPGTPPVVQISAEIVDAAQDSGQAGVECVVIRVLDNGIGFDMKYLDKVFGVFQRLHHKDAYEGTGVGMAICRRIAEHHDGSITAESVPDEGTTFIVTLPSQHPDRE